MKKYAYIVCSALSPTEESLKFIESKLGIKLPNSLILFAKLSKNYGNWLASLGSDYESFNHILTINKRLQKKNEIPKNFIVINVGYDEDYDCIDIETYDKIEDEYLITYWANDVPLNESALYENFPDYIEEHIKSWKRNA